MFYVYIIHSLKTNKYYVGSTNDVQRRLYEHSHNNTQSLKNKGPFTLILTEEYVTIQEARRREKQVKSYKGGNAFKKLIRLL